MSHTTQTRQGIDVLIDVIPDTPRNADRLQRALSHLDRLASEIAAIDPNWVITIAVGNFDRLTVIAEPITEQDTAA